MIDGVLIEKLEKLATSRNFQEQSSWMETTLKSWKSWSTSENSKGIVTTDGDNITNFGKVGKSGDSQSIVMDCVNIEKVGKVGKSENTKSIVMHGDSIKQVGKFCKSENSKSIVLDGERI